jgi:hypothetical protein
MLTLCLSYFDTTVYGIDQDQMFLLINDLLIRWYHECFDSKNLLLLFLFTVKESK